MPGVRTENVDMENFNRFVRDFADHAENIQIVQSTLLAHMGRIERTPAYNHEPSKRYNLVRREHITEKE